MNSGNLVNRIGRERRHKFVAYWALGFISILALWGWMRPVNVIAERPVNILQALKNSGAKFHIYNGCDEYAETMCNNGKD